MEIPKSFLGYKRENGRAGTRNHVIILPVDDISNACAEAVANNIKGTIALPHSYGRLQFGADLELHFRTMIGTGCNPNVAAVIVIGIEPKWTKKIVDGIAKTGKPVEGFHIERTGDIGTTMKASKKAQEFVMWASEKQREECPLSDLWISVKCGESDTTSGLAANPTVGNLMDKLEPLGVHLCFGETSELTGAEQVCATRGATQEASDKFMNTWNSYNDFILKEATDDLSESQPTAGNIAGGLTTIEEKAFGNFQKIGNCKFIDVLEPAEEPTKGKGLYFMDTSSAAAECVTLQAAAGFNIHLFPTGQGNIVGNPIEPVVKLTANPLTVKGMGEHIDCDVSKILTREMNMSQGINNLLAIEIFGTPKSPISTVLIAILLGILMGNAFTPRPGMMVGLDFTQQYILKLGIIFLGIRLSFEELIKFGSIAIPLIIICIVGVLILVKLLIKKVPISSKMSYLIAIGTSVCGATAIVATAPVINAKKSEVAYAIANITLFGVIAMIVYPYFAEWYFDNDSLKIGLFLGTSIHETSQVAASGLIYDQQFNSPETLNVATVTKLIRNTFIKCNCWSAIWFVWCRRWFFNDAFSNFFRCTPCICSCK